MRNLSFSCLCFSSFSSSFSSSICLSSKLIILLKEHGFIGVYRSGSSNIYAVNKNLAWGSWGTNHKYAKFEAKIIISESEQSKDIQIECDKVKQVAIKE